MVMIRCLVGLNLQKRGTYNTAFHCIISYRRNAKSYFCKITASHLFHLSAVVSSFRSIIMKSFILFENGKRGENRGFVALGFIYRQLQ